MSNRLVTKYMYHNILKYIYIFFSQYQFEMSDLY